jgi:hypothetical protein
MTPYKPLQFQIRLFTAETDATTSRFADMGHFINQLARAMYGITSSEQKGFKEELSTRLIEFNAWWETTAIQVLRKPLNHG